MSSIKVTTPRGRKVEIGEYQDDETRKQWSGWVDDGRHTVFLPGDDSEAEPKVCKSDRCGTTTKRNGWSIDED